MYIPDEWMLCTHIITRSVLVEVADVDVVRLMLHGVRVSRVSVRGGLASTVWTCSRQTVLPQAVPPILSSRCSDTNHHHSMTIYISPSAITSIQMPHRASWQPPIIARLTYQQQISEDLALNQLHSPSAPFLFLSRLDRENVVRQDPLITIQPPTGQRTPPCM